MHHFATFELTAQKASTATALVRLTMDRKSSVVPHGAALMVPSTDAAMQVLDCYRQACLCDDPLRQRGHFGLHDLDDRQADRWVLPCLRINASYLRFDAHHPASASVIRAADIRAVMAARTLEGE